MSILFPKKLHLSFFRMKLLNRKNEARNTIKNTNDGRFVVQRKYLLGHFWDWWKDFQENLVLEQKIFNDSYIFFSVLQNRRNSLKVENGTIHSHKYLVLNRSLWILSSLKAALFARQDLQMAMGKSIISTLAEEPNALEIIQVVVIRECYIENFSISIRRSPARVCGIDKNYQRHILHMFSFLLTNSMQYLFWIYHLSKIYIHSCR